jgi:hypothetical protein
LLADVRRLAAHLLNSAFHESSQAQVLDRRMQKRGVEINRKVMTPPVLAKLEHATLFEILDVTPGLPFCTPDGPGDAFRSAVRAEGNIEQNVSLGRSKGPVDGSGDIPAEGSVDVPGRYFASRRREPQLVLGEYFLEPAAELAPGRFPSVAGD